MVHTVFAISPGSGIGMAQCGDDCLRTSNSVALGAVIAISQAWLGTSGGVTDVIHHVVAYGGERDAGFNFGGTAETPGIAGIASFCARCG